MFPSDTDDRSNRCLGSGSRTCEVLRADMPNLAQDLLGDAPRSDGLRGERVIDEAGASGVYKRLTLNPTSASPMLAKSQFSKQLQLEKRRTDRSKAPLSMIVFHTGAADGQ